MPPHTLASLPPETLYRVAELLDATHPPSLVAFAQGSSRGIYTISSAFLFRTLKVTILDGAHLAEEMRS